MTAEDGRAWLELLAELAPRLRAEGIYKLELGPLKADLALEIVGGALPAPARRPRDTDEPEEPAPPMADPLDDGTTFGTKNAPGFAALRGM